jgi:hypothetical protein
MFWPSFCVLILLSLAGAQSPEVSLFGYLSLPRSYLASASLDNGTVMFAGGKGYAAAQSCFSVYSFSVAVPAVRFMFSVWDICVR